MTQRAPTDTGTVQVKSRRGALPGILSVAGEPSDSLTSLARVPIASSSNHARSRGDSASAREVLAITV